MDQASIIHDLLDWLESHLDQPLALDNVAAKSGYSKWHLQRMFKEVTGWYYWFLHSSQTFVESCRCPSADFTPYTGRCATVPL